MEQNRPGSTRQELLVCQLTELGSATSMKGVPRIIKSKHIFLKVLWTIATLCLLGIMIVNVTVLLTQFFSNSVVTSLRAHLMSPKEMATHFPSFTFCNIYPFASDGWSRHPDVISYANYTELVLDELNALNNKSKYPPDDLKEVKSVLLSHEGYFQYIGPTGARKVGHTKDSFIASCKFLTVTGTHFELVDCNRTTDINSYINYGKFNCYTIDNVNRNDILGVIIVLYHDDFDRDSVMNDQLMYQTYGNEASSGALVQVHNRNTTTELFRSIYLKPGMDLKILLRVVELEKLDEPFGNCENTSETKKTIYNSNGQLIDYTWEACVLACSHKLVVDKCGCFPTKEVMSAFPVNDSLPYCTDLKAGLPKLFNRFYCVGDTRKKYSEQCFELCPPPCSEKLTEVDLSSEIPWPHQSHHLQFYKDFITGRPFAQKFKVYEDAMSAFQQGNTDLHNQILRNNSHLIRDNFSQVRTVFCL